MPTLQQIVSPYIGKKIYGIKIDGTTMTISFDRSQLTLSDDDRQCCEKRHMTCDDDLDYHLGTKLLGVEIGASSSTRPEHIKDDVHDIQFLTVRTSLGVISVANHNEHNGYYGGFKLTANHQGKIDL